MLRLLNLLNQTKWKFNTKFGFTVNVLAWLATGGDPWLA